MTLIFFGGGGGGEEVRWKTVRTYGKILATPLCTKVIANEALYSFLFSLILVCQFSFSVKRFFAFMML